MIKQFPGRGHIVPISLVLIGAAVLKAQLPPDASQTSANSVKVVNAFGQNWGFPGPLLEVSPGTFSGLTVGATGTYNARAFLLTSQGALTTTYVFSTNSAVPGPFEVQAVNGRLYSGQGAPSEYFSLDLRGNIQFYPPVLPSPITFSVPTADGKLYGTESTYIGDNAFGMVTLDGAVTVLHNFSAQEGIPYAILPSSPAISDHFLRANCGW